VVLVEVLTGDHRRDFHENQLLGMCQIRPVNETTARHGARMRTATGRADEISATDAIVAAFAVSFRDPVVLTSDPADLTDLVRTQTIPVTISAV
jgi:predicted nucleic acid-binding protein